MFETFTTQALDYVNSSQFLIDSFDLSADTMSLWMQVLVGFVFELYAMQIFVSLQLTRISFNNTDWVIASLGHFCNDGKEIDEQAHFYIYNFCGSNIYQKMLQVLIFVSQYHIGLINDLAVSLEYLHTFLGKPQDYYTNMEIMEKEYREKTNIAEQFRYT